MYKADDYMVMDCDTAALSKTSPEAMAKYQRELAAVYNTIHSQDRLIDLMAIEQGVDGTLLSLLCTLLQVSVINSPGRSKHYGYYVQVHGKGKKLPSTYLMDRLNNHECVWGFPYGSLGYAMYYYPTTYMHPSRMVEVCADHYLGVNATTDITQYKEPIQRVLNNLQVMGAALPSILYWYVEGGYQYSPTNDMERKAYTTLSSMARVWLQSGLSPTSEGDVLHLTLPPQWRPLYEELVHIRRACEWVPSNSTGTVVERLLLPLMSISVLSDPQGLRTAMSYVLGICAPGGWDLLLVVLAAQVINRAYVAAYDNPGEVSMDIGEAGRLLLQAHAAPIQRLGTLVMELNNGR
jgi:hypothetical protein